MKSLVELSFAIACSVMGGYDVASANSANAAVLFVCGALIGIYTLFDFGRRKYGALIVPNLLVAYYSAVMIGYDYYHRVNSACYIFLLTLCCVSIVGFLAKSKEDIETQKEE